MANVRLLRQRLTDYNTAIDRINSRYRREYDAYAGKVEAWNAIAKATPYVTDTQSAIDNAHSKPWEGGVEAILSNNDRVPINGFQPPSKGDYYNGMVATQVPYEPDDPDYPTGVWTGEPPLRTIYVPSFSKHPTAAGELPVEPTMRKAPIQPNLTENDIRAIQNPPTNAAGVEMARAKGWTGVSELTAENEDRARISAFQSAFDNPDNPQALKDRGILAKTLAGRL